MTSAFFNVFKWLYLEIVVIIIGILLSYVFMASLWIFIIISISWIIIGGIIVWYKSRQGGWVPLAATGSRLIDYGYIVLVIILTILSIFADLIHFNKFGFLQLTIIIAVLIIISSLIIIILIVYNRIF